jgi:hypothetical protein
VIVTLKWSRNQTRNSATFGRERFDFGSIAASKKRNSSRKFDFFASFKATNRFHRVFFSKKIKKGRARKCLLPYIRLEKGLAFGQMIKAMK